MNEDLCWRRKRQGSGGRRCVMVLAAAVGQHWNSAALARRRPSAEDRTIWRQRHGVGAVLACSGGGQRMETARGVTSAGTLWRSWRPGGLWPCTAALFIAIYIRIRVNVNDGSI